MGSAIRFFGRITLVIINITLVVICLAFITAALLLKFRPSVFSSYFDSELDDIKKASKNVLGSEPQIDNFDLGELYGPFAIILIAFGAVILSASVFGFIGACCTNKKMLMMYAVLMSILVLGQIAFIVLFFAMNSTLKGYVKTPLKSMISSYHGLNSSNIESLAWNFLMMKYQCCGIESSSDFKDTDWFGGSHGPSANMLMPFACCKDLPTTAVFTCTETLDESLNNHNKVMLIVFALLLYCKDDQKKTHPKQQRRPNNQW